MKEKSMRTVWIVVTCLLALFILTAMVHVYVYFYGYPAAQTRPGLFLPKMALLALTVGVLVFSMHRGRKAGRGLEESGRLGSGR